MKKYFIGFAIVALLAFALVPITSSAYGASYSSSQANVPTGVSTSASAVTKADLVNKANDTASIKAQIARLQALLENLKAQLAHSGGDGKYSTSNKQTLIKERTKTTSRGGLTVDLKVDDLGKSSAPVVYKKPFTVSWKSNGSKCNGWGHWIPMADGGLWGNVALESSGSKKLIATHDNYGFMSSLQVGIQCWNRDGSKSVSKSVNVPVVSSDAN